MTEPSGDVTSVSKNTREFLMRDFDSVFSYRISFSGMRLAALGACLTILGLVVSLGKEATFPSVLGTYLILEIVVFAGIRVIAAINRGIMVFANHLRWIESQLQEVGFSTYWCHYLQKSSKDSGSWAFVVATRAMNVVVCLYVVSACCFSLVVEKEIGFEFVSFGAIIFLAVALFLWNESHIRHQLDPRGFLRRLAAGLDEARKAVLGERSS